MINHHYALHVIDIRWRFIPPKEEVVHSLSVCKLFKGSHAKHCAMQNIFTKL